MRHSVAVWLAVAGAVLAGQVLVRADGLVMRDGSRVDGTIISMRGGLIEFEERGGWSGGRTRTFDRSEVRRIELDSASDSGSDRDNGDRGLSSSGGSYGGGQRPGMRERVTSVDARSQWTDTGITVRAGQTVMFSATGTVGWGPKRNDGPAGESGSPRNDNRPMPNRSAAALIGRIGQDGAPFFIGADQGEILMRDSGTLYLGVNDDFVDDNSGAFRVTVSY